jgi:phosphocarrier protein HPr
MSVHDSSDFQTIKNPLGLHLRAARRLVDTANRYESHIEIERQSGPKVNAKSILGVLLLEGVQGASVRVLATGTDAREAVKAISALIANGFGEL